MLEWIYHVRLVYPPMKTHLLPLVRNTYVKGAPAFLKSSVVALFYRSEITVKTAAIELRSLNAMSIIRC